MAVLWCSVRVLDLATGNIVAELPDHPDIAYTAGFSPDGRHLVTACRDRSGPGSGTAGPAVVCPPFGARRRSAPATFTPDGRWVLSGSEDGVARAWDWRTGKPVTPPLAIGGNSMNIAVTPSTRSRPPARSSRSR